MIENGLIDPATPVIEPTLEAAAATLLTSTEPVVKTEQPGEVKDDAAKAAEEAARLAAEAKPEGAPETYEFKAPEGKEYDAAVLDTFSKAAKEANLTQDAAQKLLEGMAPALVERQLEQVKAIQTGWAEASKTDKEFGGDKLQENLAVAKKAVETYATPELRKLFDDTGLGNHPEVIRMLFKIGKGMSEDKFVAGGAPKGAADLAAKLYPNSPQKSS